MPVRKGLALFYHNPDLVKLQAATCCLMGGGIGTGMLVPTLKTQYWGKNMSSYSSMLAAAGGLMTLVGTPIFGRISDRISRRKAWLICGVTCFVPSVALLLEGSASLWAMEFISLLTAPIRQVQLIYFIYLQDLVPPDDLNLIFSTGFAIFTASVVLINLLASYVANHTKGAKAMVVFDMCFLLLYLAFTFSMKKESHPEMRNKEKSSVKVVSSSAAEEQDFDHHTPKASFDRDADPLAKGLTDDKARSGPTKRDPTSRLKKMSKDGGGSNMRTIHFLCSNPNLRNLAIIFFVIGLPETMERHIAPQFKFQTLDLMPTGNATADAERVIRQKHVTEVSKITGATSATFYGLLTGALGAAIGPLNSVKVLIPAAALSQLLPLLLWICPDMWMIILSTALSPLAMAVGIPLQALSSIVSPPDRVGEAVSAVTAVKEVAPLLANLMVPPLLSYFGTESLWVFFVMAFLMILVAIPFAFDMDLVTNGEAEEESDSDRYSDSDSDE
mmetsp:Transcript_63557/g.160376  ORF Transcript_63557/g.160376 Transcript_63557/m.160376 type:complete len:501 (-) Transcript_63557:79-1581(-)